MKNVFYLLFASFLLVGFASCSDDDNSIVGTWTYINTDAIVETNNVAATDVIKLWVLEEEKDSNHTITFTKEGTFEIKEGNTVSDSGYYTFKDNQLTISYLGWDEPYSDTFKVTVSAKNLQIENNLTEAYSDEKLSDLGLDPAAVNVSKVIAVFHYVR